MIHDPTRENGGLVLMEAIDNNHVLFCTGSECRVWQQTGKGVFTTLASLSF